MQRNSQTPATTHSRPSPHPEDIKSPKPDLRDIRVSVLMAKSIRSAIKKRFRSQKRSDRISVEDERLARLSARLEARQKKQAEGTDALSVDERTSLDSTSATEQETTPMEVESKKISTSGSRGSARETWKGGKFLAKKRAKSSFSDRARKQKK